MRHQTQVSKFLPAVPVISRGIGPGVVGWIIRGWYGDTRPAGRHRPGDELLGTLSSLDRAIGLANLGLMTWGTLLFSAAGLIPVHAGVKLGNRIRNRLSEESFTRAVLVLLIFMGATLIAMLFL